MQIKTANGKQTLKITKAEWQAIGKKQGWTKTANAIDRYSRGEMDDEMVAELSGMSDAALRGMNVQHVLRMVKKMESHLYGRPAVDELQNPFNDFKARVESMLSGAA